jgi:glycosyltransferase involved in cell wall biosynthesis
MARDHKRCMPIGLDATYSLGSNLSGIGVYSREILFGMAQAHSEEEFYYCYRPHRFLRAYRDRLPKNAVRRLLVGNPPGDLFHALNQRVDTPGRRTVSTFHDLFVMTGDYSSPDFRARFRDQAQRAAELSDLIIAVSQFTANQIRDLLHVPATRIRVVPHGVRIPPPSTVPRERLVLFVGVIQRRKNISRLVKAFERMPAAWRLALAGAPGGYGAAEELRAVEDSPRREAIEVLGYVSHGTLERLYQRASIFAFPSLDEGFGMPVLEAMAHGVAVLSSARSSLPEVVGDAALLIDPLETDAIAGGLLQLANDDNFAEDLARRGLARARAFSWDSAVDRTWNVYRELR